MKKNRFKELPHLLAATFLAAAWLLLAPWCRPCCCCCHGHCAHQKGIGRGKERRRWIEEEFVKDFREEFCEKFLGDF